MRKKRVCFACAIAMIIILIVFFISVPYLNLSVGWMIKHSFDIYSVFCIYLLGIFLLFFMAATEDE